MDSQGISALLVILGDNQPTVTAPSDSGADCAMRQAGHVWGNRAPATELVKIDIK